jgi:hypothetical protein
MGLWLPAAKCERMNFFVITRLSVVGMCLPVALYRNTCKND